MDRVPYFEPEMLHKIADDLVKRSLQVKKGEKVMIVYDPHAGNLARLVARQILELGAYVEYQLKDREMDNLRTALGDIPFLKEIDTLHLAKIQKCDCYLSISCDPEFEALPIDKERSKLLELNSKLVREQVVDEERTRRCTLYLPTYAQAEADNMSFEEYKRVYFKACNLPWDEIHMAQEKLIQKLNAGKTLKIQADINNPDPRKRTLLSMSIDGMTFANSTIKKNYPGSEVFSAPTLYSTEGTYYSPGRYFHKGKLIRDIYLRFEKGKVVEFDATEGRETLEEALTMDAGSCYVGEIGIGTNPELVEDVSDTLLFEKKGASFHIAIGTPYHYRIYDGKPVYLNNGGDSSLHWDLTQMLNREGGSAMILDGEIIQQNGIFVDPEIRLLSPKTK